MLLDNVAPELIRAPCATILRSSKLCQACKSPLRIMEDHRRRRNGCERYVFPEGGYPLDTTLVQMAISSRSLILNFPQHHAFLSSLQSFDQHFLFPFSRFRADIHAKNKAGAADEHYYQDSSCRSFARAQEVRRLEALLRLPASAKAITLRHCVGFVGQKLEFLC